MMQDLIPFRRVLRVWKSFSCMQPTVVVTSGDFQNHILKYCSKAGITRNAHISTPNLRLQDKDPQ